MTKKKATVKTVKKEIVKAPNVEEVVEEVKEEVKEAEVEVEKEVKEEKKNDVIWSLRWGKDVHQGWFLKVKAIRGQPIDKDKLPEDIQRWLTNKGYWTNVYTLPKEWLEKHNVDPVMLEKLKKFISDNFIE